LRGFFGCHVEPTESSRIQFHGAAWENVPMQPVLRVFFFCCWNACLPESIFVLCTSQRGGILPLARSRSSIRTKSTTRCYRSQQIHLWPLPIPLWSSWILLLVSNDPRSLHSPCQCVDTSTRSIHRHAADPFFKPFGIHSSHLLIDNLRIDLRTPHRPNNRSPSLHGLSVTRHHCHSGDY